MAWDGGLCGTGAPEDGVWGTRTTRASVLWVTAASYSRLTNDLLASSHDFSALLSAMTQGQNVCKQKKTRKNNMNIFCFKVVTHKKYSFKI